MLESINTAATSWKNASIVRYAPQFEKGKRRILLVSLLLNILVHNRATTLSRGGSA